MVAKREPGPKPDFFVVEDHLKCQTQEGEISLDLRVPLERLERFMELEDMPEKDLPRYIRTEIMWPEDASAVMALRDGTKSLEILMKWAEALGERMGASMGESQGSTASSGGTVEPSPATSESATASASTKSGATSRSRKPSTTSKP